MTREAAILSGFGAAQINEAAGTACGNQPMGRICIAPLLSAAVATLA